MLFDKFSNAESLELLCYLIAYLMALFVAMPFHEFAHAWAAKSEGDYTAVALKRYTLAFHKHFDLWGFLSLMIFRFGWATPVPVNSRNFKNGNKSMFKVSIAGVTMNFILGTFFLIFYLFADRFFPVIFDIAIYGDLLYFFLQISISLNFMLVVFNLLPIYPLDGYRIVDSFSKTDNGFLRFMRKYSMIVYLVVFISGIYYYIYSYTAGLYVSGVCKLFDLIFR